MALKALGDGAVERVWVRERDTAACARKKVINSTFALHSDTIEGHFWAHVIFIVLVYTVYQSDSSQTDV